MSAPEKESPMKQFSKYSVPAQAMIDAFKRCGIEHVMQTLAEHGMLDGGLRMRAMVLPDVKHGDSVNLAHYYERVRRRFWVLLTLHWLVATATSVWAQVAVGGARFSFASPVWPMPTRSSIRRPRAWGCRWFTLGPRRAVTG